MKKLLYKKFLEKPKEKFKYNWTMETDDLVCASHDDKGDIPQALRGVMPTVYRYSDNALAHSPKT